MDASTLVTQIVSVLSGALGVVITYLLKRYLPRDPRDRDHDNPWNDDGRR